MTASTQALIDAFVVGSPPLPLPPTSLAFDQSPLGHRAAIIPESSVAARPPTVADRAEDVGYVRALQASEHKMMTSIEEVNLRVSYQAQVHMQESEDFYTQLHDARTDHRDIRLEIDVTHMSRMKWQRQSAEDLAVRQMMHSHVLEARARIDTRYIRVDLTSLLPSLSPHSPRCIRTRSASSPPSLILSHSVFDIVIYSRTLYYCDLVGIMPCNIGHGANDAMDFQNPFKLVDRWQSKDNSTLLRMMQVNVRVEDSEWPCAALTWWNSHVRTLGHDAAYAMTWGTLKKKLTEKYCPKGEIKKLEIELWNLKVRGNNVTAYTQRFQELALMCTKFLADETEKVDKYISGLPENIHGNVMSARPKTLDEAIELANDLMDQKLRTYAERQNDNKRKADDSSRNNQQQQPHKKQNVARAYTAGPGEKKAYTGNLPLCTKCNYHHTGQCAPKCGNCKRYGHTTNDCRVNTNNNNNNNNKNQKAGACYECGNTGHIKKNCPKLKNHGNGNGNGVAQGRAYALGGRDASPDSNVITGTFLLNNRYATILFDTGADRSFVSTTFSALINITPTTLENYYDVELADGKIIGVNTIIRGCTLNFMNHPFNIDLMPVPLGSFDIIIGMDWLTKYHGVINYDEKIECDVFLAHITTNVAKYKSEGKQLKDVPIVKDFPEVFPEDLSGIPPARQVEFQIDLVPGSERVAQAPYRLALSEMKELA
ncbi:putative reverse transcriptase domain-containing protein [Tanacetum coccineum]